MSSRFSRRVRPQKAPRICVHKGKRLDFLPIPAPTYQSYVYFKGFSSVGVQICLYEVVTLYLQAGGGGVYLARRSNPNWQMQFWWTEIGGGERYSAELELREAGILVVRTVALEMDFWGTMPYDTLRNPLDVEIGVGESAFRLTL